jgi:hypothetical protein
MKTIGVLLAVFALGSLPLYGQQVQPSVKRHPGEHVHYRVTLADGDIEKVSGVSIVLTRSSTQPAPLNQPNAQTQFGGDCKKSSDPKVWDCDAEIKQTVTDGDYELFQVWVVHQGRDNVNFGKSYGDFHLPVVPIQNPNTFTPPSKVTVTPQP